jgi:ATP-binding cassette, subfamily B, multidrug efflux pump
MLKIFKYLRPSEWALILISIGFIAVQVWLELEIPGYMSKITIIVQTPGSTMGKIWETGAYMLLCALVG